MSGLDALAVFALELGRASAQLGIEAPQPVPIHVHERHRLAQSNALAYVVPAERGPYQIHVMWHFLWSADRRTLRCVARHEALHLKLGHGQGAMSEGQRLGDEAAVDVELVSRWGEPSCCGLG